MNSTKPSPTTWTSKTAAVSYAILAAVEIETDDTEAAREHYTQAKQLCAELVAAFPAYEEFGRNLGNVKWILEGLGK